jgi:hypothetical protein
MTPSCDYSYLAENGDTPPCWGAVSLVETIEMSNGDRVPLFACSGHGGIATHGYYLDPGMVDAPPPIIDADPEVQALSGLWAQDPGDESL